MPQLPASDKFVFDAGDLPQNEFVRNAMKKEPLKFAHLINIAVAHFFRSWNDAAQACQMTPERLMRIAQGQNEPGGADTLRILYGLKLKRVDPKMLEERGLSL